MKNHITKQVLSSDVKAAYRQQQAILFQNETICWINENAGDKSTKLGVVLWLE